MKKGNKKLIELAFLSLVMILITCFGSYSLAKYNFNYDDVLQGQFVDFIISCNAEGQTAVLQDSTDPNYSYVAYLPITVTNVEDDKVSQRKVNFSFRTPNDTELGDGFVKDAWGEKYFIAEKSKNYEVLIVKHDGNNYSEEELAAITQFEAKEAKEIELVLKIMRKASIAPISGETESFSLILDTTVPYRELFEYKIRVSDSLIIMNTSTNVSSYFGFNELNLNIKTAKSYHYNDVFNYPALVKLNLSGDLIFDYGRFILETENNLVELSNNLTYRNGYYFEYIDNKLSTIYLYLPCGSSLDCKFYIQGNCKITTEATLLRDIDKDGNSIDPQTVDYTQHIAGVNTASSDAIIFEKTA